MFIYQPYISSTDRVTWYGGEFTQLHYQTFVQGEWVDTEVRTLGGGVPAGMSELHAELVDYYGYCNTLELDKRMAMAD